MSWIVAMPYLSFISFYQDVYKTHKDQRVYYKSNACVTDSDY